MKTLLTTFILSFIILSCESNDNSKVNSPDPQKVKNPLSLYDLDSVKVGWPEKYKNTKLLDTIPISYEEFSKLDEHILTPNKRFVKNGQINIPLGENEVLIKNPDNNKFEYLGFLKKINSYVLAENSSAEGLGFSELFLINKTDLCRYYIVSIGDDRVSNPVISNNGKFLAYYYNAPYEETTSYTRIMNINDKNAKEHYLKEYAYFDTENFAVRELRWINNHELAILVYHKDIGIAYYKMTI